MSWFDNIMINHLQVISRVPQGSVLGPVLFLIFINDLTESIDASVHIFDDDTKIFTQQDQNKLQDNLTKLEEWADTWKMKFHPQICKVIHVGKDQDNYPYTMRADGQPIGLEYANDEKDLGVTIDDKLTFEQHCDLTVDKANRVLGISRR